MSTQEASQTTSPTPEADILVAGNIAFHEFTAAIDKLSPQEREAYPILRQTCLMAARAYAQQISVGFLYPENIAKEIILKASIENPALLSPYTAIRESESVLTAVSYQDLFNSELTALYVALEESGMSNGYLEVLLRKQIEGDFLGMEKHWLENTEQRINMTIGPYLAYHDQVFNVKRYYSACALLLDENFSRDLNTICSLQKEYLASISQDLRTEPHRHQVLAADVLCWAGEIAELKPIAWARPNGLEAVQLVEEFGGVSLMFLNRYDDRNAEVIDLLRNRFGIEPGNYSFELMKRALIVTTLMHELGHVYGNSPDIQTRAGDFYASLDELKADAFGLLHIQTLHKGGIIDDPRPYYLAHIGDLLNLIEMAKINPARKHHARSAGVIINRLVKQGLLQEQGGNNNIDIELWHEQFELLFADVIRLEQEAHYEEIVDYFNQNG